jgi:predicted DNA-binding transcriptional regulator AlpA
MKKYLEPNDVHVLYGISEKTLANWRSQGRGPRYLKIGRLVRYAMADLEDWERSKRVLTFGYCVISSLETAF